MCRHLTFQTLLQPVRIAHPLNLSHPSQVGSAIFRMQVSEGCVGKVSEGVTWCWEGARWCPEGVRWCWVGVRLCRRKVLDGIGKVSYGVRKVSDGVRKDSDGVEKVSYGVGKVSDGVGKVSDCVKKVSDGVGKVSHGVGKVSHGVTKVSEGVKCCREGVRCCLRNQHFNRHGKDTITPTRLNQPHSRFSENLCPEMLMFSATVPSAEGFILHGRLNLDLFCQLYWVLSVSLLLMMFGIFPVSLIIKNENFLKARLGKLWVF